MYLFDDDLVFDLRLKTLASHKDATVVEIEASIGTEDLVVGGASRRHPDDKYNKEIGTQLALARALDSLSAKLKRRANGAVKHAENVKIQQETQANRNKLDLNNLFKSLLTDELRPTTPLGRVLQKDTAVYQPKRRISNWDNF